VLELQLDITKSQSDLEREHNNYIEKIDAILGLKKEIADKKNDIKMKDESLGRLNNLDKQQKMKIQ